MIVNYDYLLNIKFKNSLFIIITIIALLIFLYISISYKTYDRLSTYGVYNNGLLYVDLNINNSDALTNDTYIAFNNKKYNFKVINISDLKQLNNINYQEYVLEGRFPKELNNKVINITFFYNKERIIKKIIKKIF